MKKLVLFLTLFAGYFGNLFGQNHQNTFDNDFALGFHKSCMVKLVEMSKTYFKKGQKLEDFCKSTGTALNELPAEEKKLITEIFSYIEKNTTSKEIISSCNGESISAVMKKERNVTTTNSNAKPKFWQKLGRTIVAIGEAIEDLADKTCCIWERPCCN